MAHHESDREDLMREATALVRRVELRIETDGEPIVAGFRRDGSLSVYFGSDPAYHFDADGRLRRAFASGHLFRTQGSTLARLTRERTNAATYLNRRDLTADELKQFLLRVQRDIENLQHAIKSEHVVIVAERPNGTNVVGDLSKALAGIEANGPTLAPAIKSKRV